MSEKPPSLDPHYGSAIRLSQIVHWLHQNPFGLSLGEIRTRLGISERTLARYLTTLRETFLDEDNEALVEVVRSTTSHGRLRWRQRRLPMEGTAYELLSLYMALEMMTFLDGTLFHQSAQEAIQRLQAVLARSQDSRTTLLLKDFGKKFFHWPDAPKDYSSHNKILDKLVQALVFQKRIELTYQVPNKPEKIHLITPLSLLMFRRALYLVARREQKIEESEPKAQDITFAVERIKDVRVMEAGFSYPPDYEPEARFQSSFGLVHETNPEWVVLHFDQKVKPNVASRRWHPSQQLEDTAEGVVLRMQVEVGLELIAWLMSYGFHVRVIEPEHLRLKLREEFRLALESYDSETGVIPPPPDPTAKEPASASPVGREGSSTPVDGSEPLKPSMGFEDDWTPAQPFYVSGTSYVDAETGLTKRGRGRPRKQKDVQEPHLSSHSEQAPAAIKIEERKKRDKDLPKVKKPVKKLPRRIVPNPGQNLDDMDDMEWDILDKKAQAPTIEELNEAEAFEKFIESALFDE